MTIEDFKKDYKKRYKVLKSTLEIAFYVVHIKH